MNIGPYEVLGEVGRGGMGVVYRVRAPSGGEAALKLLRTDPATFARFDRERRLLASLGEDLGFTGLLDAGTSREGAWLVMPLVTGGTLRARLEKGLLPIDTTIALGIELSRALSAAHERGIVHRDVKPENVLFSAGGRALLADLGLAKHFDPLARGASQSVSLTRDGAIKGTAGYMAPEQIESAASAGPPADVFALGAVLYECLAGRPAFEGANALELLARVGSGVVAPIERADVPGWLVRIVLGTLAISPGARPQAGKLAQALELGGAPPGGSRRSAAALGLGAALGAALLAGIAILGGARREEPSPPPALAPSARQLAELSRVKRKAGDRRGAIDAATAAIARDPTLVPAWIARALVRQDEGDFDEAVAAATRAIELDPEHAETWATRAAARCSQHDFDGSIADATRAIELDPRGALAFVNRGAAFYAKRDWERAFEDETRATELDPELAAAWAYRGSARGNRGDWAGEVEDETRAIELAPKLAFAYTNRGAAYGNLGNFAGAIRDFERSLELEPTSDDAPRVRSFLEDARGRVH